MEARRVKARSPDAHLRALKTVLSTQLRGQELLQVAAFRFIKVPEELLVEYSEKRIIKKVVDTGFLEKRRMKFKETEYIVDQEQSPNDES